MSFPSFDLHRSLLAGVHDAGWEKPTPIQTAAIPTVLAGRDVIGLAQTGTGKTAAFVLPLLHRLLETPRGGIRMLVVAPTRELAEQINEAIRVLGAHTDLRSAVVYGGVNINPQTTALKSGVDIVVACPGRLLDHLGRGTANLGRVSALVLDEADRMLDMGFLPDVRRVLKHLPKDRQTLLFSATMPTEIRDLAREFLRSPETIQVGNLKPANLVSHALFPVPPHLKTPLLLELLERTGTESVIVFTRTKHRAKKVARQLEASGHPATALQGNLSQNRRQEAIEGFRDGSYKIMVATDIASRGIDVSQISHVINYNMPDTVDAYTHRIGRTGRVERTGDAFTFVTEEDVAMVRAIERVLGEPLDRRKLEDFDYHAAPPPKSETAGERPERPSRRPAARKSDAPPRRPAAPREEPRRHAVHDRPATGEQDHFRPKPEHGGRKEPSRAAGGRSLPIRPGIDDLAAKRPVDTGRPGILSHLQPPVEQTAGPVVPDLPDNFGNTVDYRPRPTAPPAGTSRFGGHRPGFPKKRFGAGTQPREGAGRHPGGRAENAGNSGVWRPEHPGSTRPGAGGRGGRSGSTGGRPGEVSGRSRGPSGSQPGGGRGERFGGKAGERGRGTAGGPGQSRRGGKRRGGGTPR